MYGTDGSDYALTNKKNSRPLLRHKLYFVAGIVNFEGRPEHVV